MTKKEMIIAAIEANGYKPQVDEDGDIMVYYQMKRFYFIVGQDDEQYISVVYPQFAEVDEGEDMLALVVCNKVSREAKLAKVYIDQTLKNVTASCEFFYTDFECLKVCVEYAMNILGMVRMTYFRIKEEIAQN